MKIIKLNVCQGVGDIFWVYQKFAKHVDLIDFSITQVNGNKGKIGTRAVDFLRLLPKVRNIETNFVTDMDYKRLCEGYFPMKDLISKIGDDGFYNYSCNRSLEDGIRIENIDSDYDIEETVPILCNGFFLPYTCGEYVTLYVSGSTMDKEVSSRLSLWDASKWSKFIRSFYKQYDLSCPIILIGASYDERVTFQIQEHLQRLNFETTCYINSEPSNVTYILKNSKCYIGYQSGLNILADNLDVKQVMLYFPYLKKMLNTWCKIENWKSGVFNADTFDQTPEQVLKGLRLSF